MGRRTLLHRRRLYRSFAVKQHENPCQQTGGNQTTHEDRPTVPGMRTAGKNVGSGNLAIHGRGLAECVLDPSQAGETPAELHERLMLHEHWAQFRAPLPAHFTGQNAKQLGVVLGLVDTFLVRVQAKLKSRAGSLVYLRNHPFVQFDILGDLIGVSIDTVRQSTLRRRLVRNVGKVADSLDQLSRLKSKVCNQPIYKLVIGCDRCTLSAGASASRQRKTNSKQYASKQADKRHSRMLPAHREGPCSAYAADTRDELAPLHGVTHLQLSIAGVRAIQGRASQPRTNPNSRFTTEQWY